MSVANPAAQKKASGRKDAITRLDRAVLGKARAVATHRGVKVPALLAEILTGPIDRAYGAMLRELDSPGSE
jgi:hypothetical protein